MSNINERTAWRNASPENRQKDYRSNKRYASRHPEVLRAIRKRWKMNNPDKVNALTAKRRAAKLQRTPNWLSSEDIAAINQFYSDASYIQQLTQVPMEVDHIIPLQGENVSGLHVPWNLQLLTAEENVIKSNKVRGL